MNDDNTLDLLLGRILDRRASPADWDSFATFAQARPDTWGQLLTALRSEQGLQRSADIELSVADLVDLPREATVASLEPGSDTRGTWAAVPPRVARRARRPWTGWAAAAALALAWAGSTWLATDGSAQRAATGLRGINGAPVAAAPHAEPGAASAPDAAPSDLGPGSRDEAPVDPALLAQAGNTAGPRLRDAAAPVGDDLHGDIVGQLPLQLVSSVASADGNGLDVVYVRPVLERARVSGMYSLGFDDAGRLSPVSIQPASLLLADN